MKRYCALLFLLAGLAAPTPAAADPHAASGAALIIDPSSATLAGGKARMTVSKLQRKAASYIGKYQLRVVPYFFKNEKGTLSIGVNDALLGKLRRGAAVESTGKAVTDGSRKTRAIRVKATPATAGAGHGTVRISITTENGDLVFNTSYRFGEPD